MKNKHISHKIRLLTLVTIGLVVAMATTSCHSWRHANKQKADPKTTKTTTATSTTKTATPKPDTVCNLRYTSLSMNYSCKVEGMTVNGQIRIEKDNIIWLSASKIFEVGRAMFTPTTVQGYSKLLSKSIDGTYATLKSRWAVDLDYATLQALLVGDMVPEATLSSTPSVGGDSITLQYTQKKQGRQVKAVKRKSDDKLKTIVLTTPSAGQTITCRYSHFDTTSGQPIAQQVDIKIVTKKITTSTTLVYSKTNINPVQSYPFSMQ